MIAAPAGTRAASMAADLPTTGQWVIVNLRDAAPAGQPVAEETVVAGPGDMQTMFSLCWHWNEVTDPHVNSWVVRKVG